MKLDDVLASPCIDIHDTSEFEDRTYREREIIDEGRYKDIVSLAHDTGVFTWFRGQRLTHGLHSLCFFRDLYDLTEDKKDLALYEHHVNNFTPDAQDTHYNLLVDHWLSLSERSEQSTYFDSIRGEIDSAVYYRPSETSINESINTHRYLFDISDICGAKGDSDTDEEARRKLLKKPTEQEIGNAISRLESSKLQYVFKHAVGLYGLSKDTDDLARAVMSYNYYVESEKRNGSFLFHTVTKELASLLTSTGRNAFRKEYRSIVLDKAEEDNYLGPSFQSMKDLFLMTRLSEDKKSVEDLIERGIFLVQNELDIDFIQFSDRLLDLYKATGERKFIEMYESMTTTTGEKRHPFDSVYDDVSIALPVFEATGDVTYIPNVIAYCESFIREKKYRTAESIYFDLFKHTGDKSYFDKARDMFEITKECASEENPALHYVSFFSALDESVKEHGTLSQALSGKEYEHESLMPSKGQMNEMEVMARVSQDVRTLMKYARVTQDQDDINSVRKNISVLHDIGMDDCIIIGHICDLYQVSGASKDYDLIKKGFKSFVSHDPSFFENKRMLELIMYEGFL